MVSISPRWVSEKLCADVACGMPQSASANNAGASRRNEGIGRSSRRRGLQEGTLKAGVGRLHIWFGVFGPVYFGGFEVTMSSALTHPGVPMAKRVFAREARSRAVLLSPRR